MQVRSFSPDINPPLDGLDYSAERPFSKWASRHLETLIGGWLQLDPPCLELATLGLAELTLRGDDLNARMKFAAARLEPIPWLETARKAVRERLQPERTERKGKGTVYVILRCGYMQENGWYGAYVGSTGRPLERRFAEHRKGGKRGARGLATYGIEPLYSLFLPLNPFPRTVTTLREWETRLHECLAPVIPKVTGDVAY